MNQDQWRMKRDSSDKRISERRATFDRRDSELVSPSLGSGMSAGEGGGSSKPRTSDESSCCDWALPPTSKE